MDFSSNIHCYLETLMMGNIYEIMTFSFDVKFASHDNYIITYLYWRELEQKVTLKFFVGHHL